MAAPRTVARVADRVELGGDTQVDHKAFVVQPGQWATHDPFLMLAEDWFSTVGFDWHPHRGLETVTVVLEGELEHRDNSGGHGILGPGDVQWMTAGRGIIHSERAHAGRPVHTLQLWLNLPADRKMTEPRYQDLTAESVPVRRAQGVEARVFSGTSGDVTGPALNHVPVTMLDVRLEPGASFTQELAPTANGFVYVLGGSGRFGADEVAARAGQVVWLGDGGDLTMVASAGGGDGDGGLHVLLFAGEPVREPVVAHGPFVMNTRAQITEAVSDYQAGRFGVIPAG